METKLSDNFIFDSVLDLSIGDSDKTPFVKKNLSYVVDQQVGNGGYGSGQVIIDSTTLATGGNNFQDWSNSYIAMPYRVTLSCNAAQGTASGPPTASGLLNYLTSLKNNALIDSIQIEQGGRTIINQTANLSQFVSYKMHSITSQDNINKMSGSLGYVPDSIGAYTYDVNGVSVPPVLRGVNNTANLPTNTANFDKAEPYNSGVLARQQKMCAYNAGITTSSAFKNECEVQQVATGVIPTSASNVVLSDIHFVATIRLKDLLDYADKHPKLTRGIGYKIYLRVNQGKTTFTHASPTASTTPFGGSNPVVVTAQSFSPSGSGSAQPAQLHIGPNTISSALTYGNNITVTANSLTLETAIDSTTNALISGVRLYVPSYELSSQSQEKVMRSPVLSRPFFDIYFSQVTNQSSLSYINTQIASGLSNPKALIVVPQLSQTILGYPSQASVFNTSPATTDPQISLTNTQIKVGSQYVLFDRVNYGFTQFIENNSQLFGLNGNQSNCLNSGIIDMQKWRHNYRYYAYDISRYEKSQDNVPQMLTFESYNNSALPIDLYIYVLYERSAEFDLARGAVQVE